jgi:hypothetical protein
MTRVKWFFYLRKWEYALPLPWVGYWDRGVEVYEGPGVTKQKQALFLWRHWWLREWSEWKPVRKLPGANPEWEARWFKRTTEKGKVNPWRDP